MTVANKNNPNINPQKTLTPAAPASASVGAASAKLLDANSGRMGLIICNLHATNTVSLAFGAANAAVSGSGITLQPGQAWRMTIAEFNVEQVNAIASGAATPVSVQEFSV